MRKKRQSPAVNAGSMADIAFLLLIFFLVSTQILSDKGVKVVLPPFTENTPITGTTNSIFSIWINSENALLVEKEEMDISLLRSAVKQYILNPSEDINTIRSPKKAVITINSDNKTSYETYVQVYTELKNAYRDIWNTESLRIYSKPVEKITKDQFQVIKKKYPLKISEVEKYSI